MQNFFKKILVLYCIWGISCLGVPANSIAQSIEDKANTAFSSANYQEASSAYRSMYVEEKSGSERMLLQWFASEKALGNKGYSLACALLLSRNFDKDAYEKLAKNTANQFELLLPDKEQQWLKSPLYLGSLAFALLILSLLYVLVKKQSLKTLSIALYLSVGSIGLGLYYIGSRSNYAIVVQDLSSFMDAPSGAAEKQELLADGSLVRILSEEELWYKAEWQGRTGYIRKSNVLPF